MKQYIKTLVLVLFAGLAFGACTSNFDDDDNKITYPATFAEGDWASIYTPATEHYDYTFHIAKDNCALTYVGKEGRENRTWEKGTYEYDPANGVLCVHFEAENSSMNQEVYMFVAYQKGFDTAATKIYFANDANVEDCKVGAGIPHASFLAARKK